MRLTDFTDYALRVLMHLGAHPGKTITIREIAAAHGISHNHLVKVAVLCLCITFLTEVMTNTALATIMMPVLVWRYDDEDRSGNRRRNPSWKGLRRWIPLF